MRLIFLKFKPISLADIKSSFLCQCYSSIKVCSALKFLPKTCVFVELGKEGGELLC